MLNIETVKPAVDFLKHHGQASIVSLGCGNRLNRIDNHLRLMIGLNLKYYVGIDCELDIESLQEELFMDSDAGATLLADYYQNRPEMFRDALKLFPDTFVEDLAGVHCAAVVCQRVLPDRRWEDIIKSMNPKIILQEDLHGCERQQLRGYQYVRSLSGIRRHGLRPFRPWPIFPGENNLVLWRRRDFIQGDETLSSFRWLRRLGQAFIG
jgi:hypothetical protein